MEEVMAGIYLVSINRSRYSAVYGGVHAKTAFLHARPSARQRISGSTVYMYTVYMYTGRCTYTVYTVYCVYGVHQCTQCVLNLVHEQTQADFSSRGNPK